MQMTRKHALVAVGRAARVIRAAGKDLDPQSIRDYVLSCRPSGATGAYAFKWDYLASEMLSKYNDTTGKTGVSAEDRKSKAVAKMLKANARCKHYNIAGLSISPSILFSAQRIINSILGEVEPFLDSDSFLENATFTGGASVCRRRAFGDPYFKYDSSRSLSVTPNAKVYGLKLIASTPLWVDQQMHITVGNSVFTVPKNSDIDRSAAKEPAINQAFQSAIGSYIRSRLKRVGIDLNDQSRNRHLARKGSKDGSLCTIDLSSASDSISRRCVFELLPLRWYHLLDTFRSPVGVLPSGDQVTWEMFSSMGNGYTFELESLIFYALVKATQDELVRTQLLSSAQATETVSIYGDDIICSSAAYEDVVSTLEAAGFTVNLQKSFSVGPFRESCGGHYFNGVSVKPFYIRTPIDSFARVIWLVNAIRGWAADDDGWCDPSVYNLWLDYRRRYIPSCFLGGRDVGSITACASPEDSRFVAYWAPIKKSIDGYRAVLRHFQSSSCITADFDLRRITYGSAPYLDVNTTLATSKDGRKHEIFIVGSRETLTVRKGVSVFWKLPLFPQEAVDHSLLRWETT